MNSVLCKAGFKATTGITRCFSVTAIKNADYSCKLLVIGGGTGGCTMAAKFAKRLKKDAVIVLEPSSDHYYQPLFTLVGAGVTSVAATRRNERSVLPDRAKWLQDSALSVDPKNNKVKTTNGHTINYEYMIIAAGLVNDYAKVPGLKEALKDKSSGVSTIFSQDYCEKTWSDIKNFKGGDAIFTYPDTPIKCPGAPQKIAYMADAYFNKSNVRSKSNITYNTCLPVIFGVKKYADVLLKIANRKNIKVNYKTVLREIRPEKKEAVFIHTEDKNKFKSGNFDLSDSYRSGRPSALGNDVLRAEVEANPCQTIEELSNSLNKPWSTIQEHLKQIGKQVTLPYNLLHVTPPMKTPSFLQTSEDLVDGAGYLTVDKYTLQHTKYENIYGIGDCTNTPNSKTAAAVAKQSYVVEQNLLRTMGAKTALRRYDGYGACPLVTSYNTCVLAEFVYDGVPRETLPFNQVHYYQPLFTLVGAGLKDFKFSHRQTRSILPRNVIWLKDAADEFDPCNNVVYTAHGYKVRYEHMVVAVGLKNDYEQDALDNPLLPVSTSYSPDYCQKCWCCIKGFKGGHALFTFPKTPGKCSGAAQKIMYLANDYWRLHKIDSLTNITYNTAGSILFGVSKYAGSLQKIAMNKNITINYNLELIEVTPKQAIFMDTHGQIIYLPYKFLHVTPSMSPPVCLTKCEELAVKEYLDVDKHTLQHTRYNNIYGVGDCVNTPNSKTAAAISKQSYVVASNIWQTMYGKKPNVKYDGYCACPVLTSLKTGILAEFVYDKIPHETFPFDQAF
ncbi:unnamed protein product [Danaus chrysippus]|uniref:Sulfide:quinone oxidoreductase, mitochondrial n=1 Tax=Danaus chrysippus TaxID=151541 RepID=A0A8J2R8Q8_9NEOP|nr:unnamed protein product [Danaus chrysippus]